MIRLAIDEDFNNNILRGVLRRSPDLDIVRVQDVGLSGADDPTILDWCAHEGRVPLTHDVSTMTKYAYARVEAGQPMPGMFEVSQSIPMGRAIEDILLIAGNRSGVSRLASRVARNSVERVSRGAGSRRLFARAAPFDTTSASPRSTQDAP